MNHDTINQTEKLKHTAQLSNICPETGITRELDHSKRFQKISERQFRSDTSENERYWEDYGKYKTHYRGIKMLKDPKSLLITYQLMYEINPKTVFEMGTYKGAFSLWLADQLDLLYNKKQKTNLFSLEKFEELVDPLCKNDSRIKFLFDDVSNLPILLTPEVMEALPHPWILFEDCHANLDKTLEFFSKYMKPGDYFFIEDLSNVSPDQTSYNPFKIKKFWDGSLKRKELFDWVENTNKQEQFMVDTYYSDFFGYNGSVQWDGIMRKMN